MIFTEVLVHRPEKHVSRLHFDGMATAWEQVDYIEYPEILPRGLRWIYSAVNVQPVACA